MKTQEFTHEEYDKLSSLLKLCKDYDCFIFDNLIIKGLKVDIIKKYIHQNPSKKFSTWLIDNNYVLTI